MIAQKFPSELDCFLKQKQDEHLQALRRLVQQPSISAHDRGVEDCARLLCSMMQQRGIEAEVIPTSGQPVVYGEIQSPQEDAYTLLCYGHYDVQPPEPLDKWTSPPFEPQVRDGRLFGRGTGDNKGQLIAHVLAAEAWRKVEGKPPINLKFVFEGEEESGSPHLREFVSKHRERLSADLVYISDGGMHPSGDPVISLGNRGIVGITLLARGADRDNHSGNKGGVAPNPVWMLVHVLANLVDSCGEVMVPGFYDDVRPIGPQEERLIEQLPFDPEEFGRTMGLSRVPMGKQKYYRRIMLQPYFNISGISSGYVGPGSKTIIPAEAECRIDIRMVADQTSSDVVDKVKKAVEDVDPRVEVIGRGIGAMEPSRTRPDHPAVDPIKKALQAVSGRQPHVKPSGGGSLPNAVWPEELNTPHIGVPYANADENNHSPDENLRLDCYYRGIRSSARVFWQLAKARAEGDI